MGFILWVETSEECPTLLVEGALDMTLTQLSPGLDGKLLPSPQDR
jgi:hypothetical protein